ncbi:unnamed protein product [Arctogadus glacialis]
MVCHAELLWRWECTAGIVATTSGTRPRMGMQSLAYINCHLLKHESSTKLHLGTLWLPGKIGPDMNM